MYVSGNRLLDALPAHDRTGLDLQVEIVTLPANTSTHTVGALVAYVDFPINAVLSVVALLENGEAVEVATVGQGQRVQQLVA
jgi:hypothetical protein